MESLYILGLIALAMVITTVYCACVLAGRADDQAGYDEGAVDMPAEATHEE